MKKQLKQLDIPDDIASNDDQLNRYLQMIADGESPKMAALLASQIAPGIGITDTNFIADQNRHGRSILDRLNGNKVQTEVLRRNLARRGYKLQSDDHYISTVARFPGDPEAIVNHKNTLGDLKRKLQNRGVRTQGMFTMEGDSRAPQAPVHRLNPRIVERIDKRNLVENPDLQTKPKADRHAEIIERHGNSGKA